VQVVPEQGNVCAVVPFNATEIVVVDAGTNIGRRAVAAVPLCARLIEKLTGVKPCGPAVGFVTGAPAVPPVCGATEPPPPPPHALTRKRQPARTAGRYVSESTTRASCHSAFTHAVSVSQIV
jgi:hypothetical protein